MTKRKNLEKTDIFFAAFLLVWFIYLFYPFHYEEGGISADGVTYAHIAKNIILDGSPGWQATWAAPFYSILMAGSYLATKNFSVSGYLVTITSLWLLPVAVYLLASSLFDKRIAFISAVLTSLHPYFLAIPAIGEPEAAFTTLLIISFVFLWLAYSKNSVLYAILSGLFFSVSYLTRSEGLLIFIFALAAFSFLYLKDRNYGSLTKQLLIIGIVFLISSLPYLLFLKDTYGKWVLSPKSAYVQIWMKWRIYHDNNLGEQGNPELWGLSKNGKLMWQEPKGLGELASYLMSDPLKSLKVYLYNFSLQIPGRIPKGSGQRYFPQVYPWYFAIPALFWIAGSFKRKDYLDKTILLISPFAILFVLPVFSDGWFKYLQPYSPFLIILAVAGINSVCERFRWRNLLSAFAIVIAVYSIWALYASRSVKQESSTTGRISMAQEQKKAGEWAQERFKGTPNYMVQWSKLAYYLNGRWTAMPVADYYGIVWYGRKHKVDYLVFETGGRSESAELIGILENTADLEVADVYESTTNGYGVVFLRFKK